MTKRIEILSIGSEVVRGEVQEHNSAVISRALFGAGLEIRRITALPDDLDLLVPEIRAAAARSDAVIVTGGLGPTVDDLTKEAAIRALDLAVEERREIVEGIERRLAARGREMPAGYRDQGRIPVGAEVLPNPVGLAAGLRIRSAGAELFLLPGVPSEMKAMLEGSVLPALSPPGKDARVRLRTWGLTETELEDALRRVLPADSLARLSIISSPRGVDAYLPPGPDQAANAAAARRELASFVFAEGSDRLEEVVVRLLISRRETLASAESVTGGLLASTIVSVPGASEVFREGFVAYANEAKIARLGVARETLEGKGAVSEEACLEMARGARSAAGADWALSTTGIAGPTGAAPGKPVGLCYVGLASSIAGYCRAMRLFGDREMVRLRAAYAALDMARLALTGETERLAAHAKGSGR